MTQYKDWNAIDTLAAAYAAAGDFKSAQQWISTAEKVAPADQKAGLQNHIQLIQANKPIVR